MTPLLLAATAIVNFAQPAPGESHADCLKSVALALEASGEGLGEIAAATVSACIPVEDKRSDAFSRVSPKTQEELLRLERDRYRQAVQLRMMRLRACRKTVGCDVNALP